LRNGGNFQNLSESYLCGFRFIERYLLCQKCKYPETSMFIKQKKFLMSKCRACGNENTLDSTHRAGAQLLKQIGQPSWKEVIEIEKKKKEDPSVQPGSKEEDKVDPNKRKKEEEPVEEEPDQLETIRIDSEEIGKLLNQMRKLQ